MNELGIGHPVCECNLQRTIVDLQFLYYLFKFHGFTVLKELSSA